MHADVDADPRYEAPAHRWDPRTLTDDRFDRATPARRRSLLLLDEGDDDAWYAGRWHTMLRTARAGEEVTISVRLTKVTRQRLQASRWPLRRPQV